MRLSVLTRSSFKLISVRNTPTKLRGLTPASTHQHPTWMSSSLLVSTWMRRAYVSPPPRSHASMVQHAIAHPPPPHAFISPTPGTFITDVWRIFSAAKGSSAFHNKCLWQTVNFYRGVIGLRVVIVCTDGCRGQYKGRRNFYCLGLFASEHTTDTYEPGTVPMSFLSFVSSAAPSRGDLRSIVGSVLTGAFAGADVTMTDAALSRQPVGPTITPGRRTAPAYTPPPVYDVSVRHLFACGHHFKGPHDGYGKDAKFMPKTAERHQKVRLATTHSLYYFNATNLPCPRSNVKASDLVASLQTLPPHLLAPLDKSKLPQDWASVLKYMNPQSGTSCLPCDTEPAVAPDIATPPAPDDAAAAASLGPSELEGLEGLEVDDVNARPTISAHEEDPDSEPEDTSAGDFDFEFDETGARLGRDEQLDDAGCSPTPASSPRASSSAASSVASSAAASSSAPSSSTLQPSKAAKHSRKSRVITSVHKAAAQEEQAGGEVRVATQRAKEPGIFSASAYFWLYYAVYPAVGVKLVPVGTLCKTELEAHAILDPVENVDADSVTHSNSTYEFAGVEALQPGLLYAKTLPCMCSVCKDPSSIR